jgi:hypothetical protein
MPFDFAYPHFLPANPARNTHVPSRALVGAILQDWRPLSETARRRTSRIVALIDGLLADWSGRRR